MKVKTGVIEDVKYVTDQCVIHVDCGDGVHIATLPMDAVEKHGFIKGMKVEATIDDAGNVTGLKWFT